jgi:CBS domain-containing protein
LQIPEAVPIIISGAAAKPAGLHQGEEARTWKPFGSILKAKGGDVVRIGAESPVVEALTVMAEKNIGAVLVVDGKGDIAGIFSERDFARQNHCKRPRYARLREVREIHDHRGDVREPDTTIDACHGPSDFPADYRHLPVKEKGEDRRASYRSGTS